MTLAEQQQKEAQQKAEIESQAKPRINLLRPSNRVASRGNSYSAAASTTTSSSSSSTTTTSSSSSSSRAAAAARARYALQGRLPTIRLWLA